MKRGQRGKASIRVTWTFLSAEGGSGGRGPRQRGSIFRKGKKQKKKFKKTKEPSFTGKGKQPPLIGGEGKQTVKEKNISRRWEN